MKPKISSGYLTPQIKKKKNVAKDRLSDAEESSAVPRIDDNIFAALMKCPEKKKMILELLASNKDAIDKYKKKEANQLINSPLGKVKSKKRVCESPTALFRRRALEQMNTSPSSTNKSSSSRSELSKHKCSETSSTHSESPVPFDKVLDGVIAYVEIKNKDQDRSSGAKAILKSMGAKLQEKFTNNVTHVIFKDGSFMTYQKAKLLKIHLVSILWVEFCRKTMKRQPEKQYPALNSGFQDNETSMICSQMQKEYEDIIRDEYRRSIINGTPLPSTKSLMDRRRTLMTPSVSYLNSSTASFQTAVESMSSQERSDREVAAINEFHSESEVIGEENLILNDPECFSEVSGPMINGDPVKKHDKTNSVANCVLKSVENLDFDSALEVTHIKTSKTLSTDNTSPQNQACGIDSDMEITMVFNSNKTPKINGSKSDFYNQTTPKLSFQKKQSLLLDRRKTICNSLLSSDTSTSLISSDKSTNASRLLSSDKSTNISDKSTNISNNSSFAVPRVVKKSKRSSSNLFGSNDSFEFGKNKAKTSKITRTELDETTSAILELHLSSDRDASKRSSTMSSLQISLENKENGISNSLPSMKNSSGALQISSERKEKEKFKSLTRKSSSLSGSWLSSKPKANQKRPERSTSMSELHLSSEKTDKDKKEPIVQASLNINDKIIDQSSMSTLHISAEDNKKSEDKSSMSTLQVSSESKRSSGRNNNIKTSSSDQSAISSLHLSSEVPSNSTRTFKERVNNASFSSIDKGSSSDLRNLVHGVIENLQTLGSIGDSKISDQSPASLSRVSINSDDSEILSPRRNIRKTMGRQKEDNSLKDSYISEDSCSTKRGLELLSTVTKRRKTLGSRRGTNVVSNTLPKESAADIHTELVINIVKSPLIEKLGNNWDDCDDEEPRLINKKARRILGKGLKDTKVPKLTVKKPSTQNEKQITNIVTKNKVKTSHAKNASETSTSDSENGHSSNNKTNSDDSSTSSKSRRVRKLYNPDDSIHVLIDDEKEREEKRLEVRNRKPEEGVFINPGDILKSCDKRPKKTSPNKGIDLESSDENTVTPPRLPEKVKKRNKKAVKKMSLNSSADEQKDLLEEIINKKNSAEVVQKTPKSVKKNTPKRIDKTLKLKTPAETPSRRKSVRIIKSTQKLIDSQKSAVKSVIPITPINRRSTLDFQQISPSKRPKKVDKTKLPTIVCTKLHKSDVQVFTQIIKKLGRFTAEDEVSNRTTHLVAGEPKRTINMLRAISRGCWVLKFEWVLKSLEAGKWLREEDFEVRDFSPVVQKCRLERQAFGPIYTLDVFESCPPIYVALGTNPRCSDLKDLIITCRGKVVSTPRMAKIIVGEFLNQEDTVCVNATWVLDCITFNKRMGLKKQYVLEKDNDTNNKRKSLVV